MPHNPKLIKLIAIIFGIFTAIIIGISIFFINYYSVPDLDDSSGEEIFEKTAFFTNRYLLDALVGYEKSSYILDHISATVLSEDELNSAPHANIPTDSNADFIYTTNLVEDGYRDITPSYPATHPAIFIPITISDGREYNLYVLTDAEFGQHFIATSLQRTDMESTPILYINAQPDYNTDYANTWMSSLVHTDNFIIVPITTNL